MSIKGREPILSENITGVLQNTLLFKRCILQELQVRVGPPIRAMGNLQRGTASPPSEPEPQSCTGLPSAGRGCLSTTVTVPGCGPVLFLAAYELLKLTLFTSPLEWDNNILEEKY